LNKPSEFYNNIFDKVFTECIRDWSSFPIGGRIRRAVAAWRCLGSSNWVLRAVAGVELGFQPEKPLTHKIFIPALSLPAAQQDILRQEVESLLQKEAVRETTRDQLFCICRLFTVKKAQSAEVRPVHNLKPVNEYLATEHF
jgi:hypothetical protein